MSVTSTYYAMFSCVDFEFACINNHEQGIYTDENP